MPDKDDNQSHSSHWPVSLSFLILILFVLLFAYDFVKHSEGWSRRLTGRVSEAFSSILGRGKKLTRGSSYDDSTVGESTINIVENALRKKAEGKAVAAALSG